MAFSFRLRNGPRALYLAASLILLAGFAGAALIYEGTIDDRGPALEKPAPSVSAYAVPPLDSKQYRSDLQNLGGDAAFATDRLHWWLADLWHGRRLAYVLAVLAAAGALACWLAGRRLSRRAPRAAGADPQR
jgi:hypothetical protein